MILKAAGAVDKRGFFIILLFSMLILLCANVLFIKNYLLNSFWKKSRTEHY